MTGSRDRSILLPLLVGTGARVLCLVLLAPQLRLLGDSVGYVMYARNLLEHGGSISAADAQIRPPLYFLLVALGLDTGRDPPSPYPWVFAIQLLTDVATGFLVTSLARRRFGALVARLTAWIWASLPTSILFASSVVMAESAACFGTALALVAVDGLERAWREGRPWGWRAFGTGVAFGVAVQLKEFALLLAAAFVVALLLHRSVAFAARAKAAAIVVTTVALSLLPFTVYTWQRIGTPLPTGTYGYLALVYDNAPPGVSGFVRWNEAPTIDRRLELARSTFVDAFLEYPGLTARRAAARLRVLFGPDIFLPAAIFKDTYDEHVAPPRSTSAFYADHWALDRASAGGAAQLVITLGTWFLLTFGTAGLLLARPSLIARTVFALIGVLIVVVALTVSMDRYRQVLVPCLLPFAGAALRSMLARVPPEGQHGADAWTMDSWWKTARVVLAVGTILALTMFVLPAPTPE